MDDEGAEVISLLQAPDAIELRHLRSFVAVADELNFGRAAARLYLSQPALSRQISSLERLVGCELLRRSTRRVELTLAGEALLDRAREMLRSLDEAVTVTRSVGGELLARANQHWELAGLGSELAAPGHDTQQLRDAVEALHAQFEPPPGISVRPVNAAGVAALLSSPQPGEPATVLHLHGGAYMAGSAFGYRPLAGCLADAAGAGVLVPDYRLAPEYPFPAAVEDAMRAYLWMLDQGTDPAQVAVAGDSAGAGLVLSLLLTLRQQGLRMPGAAVLMCPWIDFGAARRDDLPTELDRIQHMCTEQYLAGHPADDPMEVERARRAVREERVRIARELHDVVAHSLSVVTIQAGVGRRIGATRPGEALGALRAVEVTGRGALEELRRILGLLRDEEPGQASLAPVPGIADLEELADSVRAAGVPVELAVSGDAAGLPPAVALTAYRIVQEALTNVVKHASRAEASVRVRVGPDGVRIMVTDTGPGGPAGPGIAHAGGAAGQHGIVGMRERAAAFGGTLEAGPLPGGGFRVTALLPVSGLTAGQVAQAS